MCNANNYNNVMVEIAKYRVMKKEVEAILSGLEEELKQYMAEAECEELIGEEHTATYKPVTSKRLDTKALKVDLPEVYDKYTRESTSARFNFS